MKKIITSVSFKKDGKITIFGNWVGNWSCEDVWKSYGKTDKSGNKLVKCFYHAYLINGEHIYLYTRNELKEAIDNRWYQLSEIAGQTNDEQKQICINNVEHYAGKEVRKISELTGEMK